MELSRSEQKRRIKQVEELVVELVKFPVTLLNELPVSEEVRELVKEVPALKGGARKRQVKYITKLLRREPIDNLYEFLAGHRGNKLVQKKRFHEIEHLRDSLIEEAIAARRQAKEKQQELAEDWQSEVVQEIAAELPTIDSRSLTRLAGMFAMTRKKKHGREIFRMLQAAREQDELNRRAGKGS